MKSIKIEAADALQVLRLSNTELFGTAVPSGWLFRGHRRPEFQLVPGVWREGFLEYWLPKLPHLARICREFDSNRLQPGMWPRLTDEQKSRFPEAIARLAIEEALVQNFRLIARDVGLISTAPSGHPWGNLSVDPQLLLDSASSSLHDLAQHYQVCTSLLDWSGDPITALAFAVNGREETDLLTIWAIDRRGIEAQPMFKSKTRRDFRLEFRDGDRAQNSNLHAQHGAFTYINRGQRAFIETGRYPRVDEMLCGLPNDHVLKFEISVDASSLQRLHLQMFRERRTAAHLMPDLKTCAQTAVEALSSNLQLNGM